MMPLLLFLLSSCASTDACKPDGLDSHQFIDGECKYKKNSEEERKERIRDRTVREFKKYE